LLMCWFVSRCLLRMQSQTRPVFSQRRSPCASTAQLCASVRFQSSLAHLSCSFDSWPSASCRLFTQELAAALCTVYNTRSSSSNRSHSPCLIAGSVSPVSLSFSQVSQFRCAHLCSSAKIYILPLDTAALLSSPIPQICAPL
jgi:hypothetical protein